MLLVVAIRFLPSAVTREAELTLRIRALGMCEFVMPSGQDIWECKLLWRSKIVADLVQAPTKDWDINGQEDSSVSHVYCELASLNVLVIRTRTFSPPEKLFGELSISNNAHLHHIRVVLSLQLDLLKCGVRV